MNVCEEDWVKFCLHVCWVCVRFTEGGSDLGRESLVGECYIYYRVTECLLGLFALRARYRPESVSHHPNGLVGWLFRWTDVVSPHKQRGGTIPVALTNNLRFHTSQYATFKAFWFSLPRPGPSTIVREKDCGLAASYYNGTQRHKAAGQMIPRLLSQKCLLIRPSLST